QLGEQPARVAGHAVLPGLAVEQGDGLGLDGPCNEQTQQEPDKPAKPSQIRSRRATPELPCHDHLPSSAEPILSRTGCAALRQIKCADETWPHEKATQISLSGLFWPCGRVGAQAGITCRGWRPGRYR